MSYKPPSPAQKLQRQRFQILGRLCACKGQLLVLAGEYDAQFVLTEEERHKLRELASAMSAVHHTAWQRAYPQKEQTNETLSA